MLRHAELAGTLGARLREQHTNVDVDQWSQMARRQIGQLIQAGMAEDFLVTALRDHIGRNIAQMAELGPAVENREGFRRKLLADAEDPVQIEHFREHLVAEDPSAVNLHPDQVADKLREMADHVMPPDADEATKKWSANEAWKRDVTALLSDDVVATWRQRFAINQSA